MVRLNKTDLPAEKLERLFLQLSNHLSSLSQKQTDSVLNELLGREEKIMVAKRLAIIILLLEGASLYKVSETLKVSAASAMRAKTKLENEEYKNIVKTLRSSKAGYLKILDELDALLHLGGILPRYGDTRLYKK